MGVPGFFMWLWKKYKGNNFVFDKYMNKHGYHGPYSWYAILAKAAGITTEDFVKNPTLVSINNLDNYADTVTNIANNIKDVS